MLIVAGLILNCCVFGALFRPIDLSPKTRIKRQEKWGNNPRNGEIKSDKSGDLDKVDLESHITTNGINNSMVISPSRHSFCTSKIRFAETEKDCLKSKELTSSNENLKFQSLECPLVEYDLKGNQRTLSQAYSGILYRKDIFYNGSLNHIPQYKSNPILYSSSMTSINNYAKIESEKNDDEDDEDAFIKPRDWFCCSKEVKDTFNEMMDFSLLKNVVFLLFAISNFLTSLGNLIAIKFHN